MAFSKIVLATLLMIAINYVLFAQGKSVEVVDNVAIVFPNSKLNTKPIKVLSQLAMTANGFDPQVGGALFDAGVGLNEAVAGGIPLSTTLTLDSEYMRFEMSDPVEKFLTNGGAPFRIKLSEIIEVKKGSFSWLGPTINVTMKEGILVMYCRQKNWYNPFYFGTDELVTSLTSKIAIAKRHKKSKRR